MSPDAGLEATRAIREKISREHGNDPGRLVAYYMELQREFADRLIAAPSADLPADPRDGEEAPSGAGSPRSS